MSFTKYMLDELKMVVRMNRKKTLEATLKTKNVQHATKQCYNLGCSLEDIRKTVEEAFNESRPN